jgi:hypothetical protein
VNSEFNRGLLFPAHLSLGRNGFWIASIVLIDFLVAHFNRLFEAQPESIAALWCGRMSAQPCAATKLVRSISWRR